MTPEMFCFAPISASRERTLAGLPIMLKAFEEETFLFKKFWFFKGVRYSKTGSGYQNFVVLFSGNFSVCAFVRLIFRDLMIFEKMFSISKGVSRTKVEAAYHGVFPYFKKKDWKNDVIRDLKLGFFPICSVIQRSRYQKKSRKECMEEGTRTS